MDSTQWNFYSRLDRCLVSLGWLDKWQNSVQHVLNREFSDHSPIVVKHLNQEWGLRPFRVLNCRLSDSRFRHFVESSWRELVVRGVGSFVLKEKLKLLKTKLRKWNSEIFGDLNLRKKESIEKLNLLDQKAEEQQLSVDEITARKELIADYWHVLNLNESLLCQKSRVRWLREGDANTSYFHVL